MGYEITTSYERYRETYKTKDIKITLDEFPFGYILEIEGEEDSINKICDLLKLDREKSYPLSCDDVYVELCEKQNIKPKDHILFDDSEIPKIS
jgi:adenylate cyclase class IV